jgi:hypothetical protein
MAKSNIAALAKRVSRSLVGGSLAAAFLATPNTHAQQGGESAGSQSGLTTLYETSLSAGGSAAEFSDHKNSIGVVVFYGDDVDPMQLGDAFASELRRRGVNAKSFAAPIGGNGASILYQVGPAGIGPIGVQSAAQNISKAIELSQARDRILSSDYVRPE